MPVDALNDAADVMDMIDEPSRRLLRRLTHFVAERLEWRGAETVSRGGKSARRYSEASIKLAQKDFWCYVFGRVGGLQLKPGALQTLVQEYYLIATFLPELGELLLKHEWVNSIKHSDACPSKGRISQFYEDFERYCREHPLED